MKFRPLEKAVVSPYLLGGAAVFRVNPSDKNGEQLPNNTAGVYSQTQYGFPAGLGISTFLSENFSIDLEGLYHFTLTDYLDDIERNGDKDAFVTATIGVSFHFGKPKDTDGDGIPDRNDADPLRPEDFDGYQDLDGAPDLDNDEDGVPDVRDKAPMQPEDIDGFEDEDGAPDLDNDGDGILDDEDAAPNDPEDVDQFQDTDGAPDRDNDEDTVPDSQDECPGTDQTVADGTDTRETLNGYEDKDGCPDIKPEIAVEKGESIVLEGVYFATGSANLTQNSRAILDKVYRTLRDNPEIEVEIQGHTDNTGGYELNMRLSKQRADAVKLYLINRGIDAARIRTSGFGPDKPIAPNTSREGRAQNRRIEFYRIK
jgi:outer membrane protein OmpA-like peptidoglycan-associated protein